LARMTEEEFVKKRMKNSGMRKKIDKHIDNSIDNKTDRMKVYRKEASRLSSMANKRIDRLEKASLEDSPAYKKWIDNGSVKFGIKGKDHNEVQKEVARLRNFIGSESSTVRGINRTLKEMASNTGIKYSSMKDLRQSAGQFFDLAAKIEQYLRTVEDMASSIGYQKIWEQINKYVQKNEIRLDSSENNVEELTQKITKAMDIYDEKESFDFEDGSLFAQGWYTLDKD